MPRKGKVRKREILPDPKYGTKLVAKFVNTIMGEGKESVRQSDFYRSLTWSPQAPRRRVGDFQKGLIENTRPTVEVRSAAWAARLIRCPLKRDP